MSYSGIYNAAGLVRPGDAKTGQPLLGAVAKHAGRFGVLAVCVMPLQLTSTDNAVAKSSSTGPATPPAQDSYTVQAGPLVQSVFRECEIHYRDVTQIYARQDGFIAGQVSADELVEAHAPLGIFEADVSRDALADVRAQRSLAQSRREILQATVIPAERTILKNQLQALEHRVSELKKRAETAASLFASGDISEVRQEQVKAELQAAIDELDTVSSTGAIKSANSEMQLAELEAELISLDKRLRRQEEADNALVLQADAGGRVIYADARLQTGQPTFVRKGELLFTLATSDALEASARFNAEDVWLVRGASAEVTQLNGVVSSTGQVGHIVRLPRAGPISQDEHVVTVALTSDAAEFDPLRRTECRFDRIVSETALSVPSRYLVEEDGKVSVIRRVGRDLAPTPVSVGQSQQGTVEITSGLNPGDQLALPQRTP